MKFQYDHDYHIHTMLSLCSKDPEQNPETILAYARKFGLKRVILTDHYWDENIPVENTWYQKQNTEHVRHWLPLPVNEDVEMLFGCEIDMDKEYTLGISKERFDEFDFIIVPTTHMHTTWSVPEDAFEDNAKRMQLWINRLDAVLDADLPFRKVGIAHLACGLLARGRENCMEVLNMLPENELERLFTKAAQKGCGIEINADDMKFTDGEQETVMRIFRVAKRCGCKFYLGSDAHHPRNFDELDKLFGKAIDLLGLTEEDKFVLG